MAGSLETPEVSETSTRGLIDPKKAARNHVASALQDLENAMKMASKSRRMSAVSKKDVQNGQQQLEIQTKTGSGEEIQSIKLLPLPPSWSGQKPKS